MSATLKPFLALTASDLMSRELTILPQEMSLRGAARLLTQAQVTGAPVVDGAGCCVGVLSATDFLRRAQAQDGTNPRPSGLPRTCSSQARLRDSSGRELVLCTLCAGSCSLQKHERVDGRDQIVCRQPSSVPTDWQVVEVEGLPLEEIREYMTPNPVTASMHARINELAQKMLEAHIHRIIIVDEHKKPVGLVSTTDILRAVAHAEGVMARPSKFLKPALRESGGLPSAPPALERRLPCLP